MTRSENADAARDFVELRMTVRLVVARIEERSHVVGCGCRDRRTGHDPDAHGFTTPSVDVASVLKGLLGGGGMHAAGMLVRFAFRRLKEDFPERPLRVWGSVAHAASLDVRCLAA